MYDEIRVPNSLKAKINEIYNQYQCADIMRCWIRFGCFSFAFIVLITLVLYFTDSYSYSNMWPIGIFFLVELAAFVLFVIRPIQKPVTRHQIALFIEENYPELENRLVSAVDFETRHEEGASAWMLEQFFQEADINAKRITFSKILDSELVTRLLLTSAAFIFLCGSVIVLFHHLWIPKFTSIQTATPELRPLYNLSVEPGNFRVRMGDNQTILGSSADNQSAAFLHFRSEGKEWLTINMDQSPSDGVYYYTFSNIQNDIQYNVQIGDRRSETFTIQTWIPPKLESIDIAYHYPEYLNKPPEEKPNIESISAIEGTRVDLTAWVNKPLLNAEMVFNASETITMQENTDISWTGSFILSESGRFSIALTDKEGNKSEFDPQFDITVQTDNPPKITLKFPKNDLETNALEEIPFEFEISDDFGIKEYGLLYEVAGEDRVYLPLHHKDQPENEVKAAHVLELETLNLQAGDLMTWAVWARDFKPDRNEFEELSDPFFIVIRPFRMLYEEAVSNAGTNQQQQQQQNQQGGQEQNALDQKEIIIATWNLRRDAQNLESEEFLEKRGKIIEAQQNLIENYTNPQSTPGEFAQIRVQLLEAMNQAVTHLESAELPAPSKSLGEAIIQAQKAYRLILKMKPDRTQVQQQLAGNNQGNQSRNQPDISELELDRQRNFYEEERRSQQQLERSEQALNQINDLARRQQSINEEISKLISENQKEQSPEELKRQLERLEQEERRNLERLDEMESELAMNDQRDSQTTEAMQRLNDVRQQMNQGLEQIQNNQLQEARVSGTRALNALDRMEEEFQQLSREGAAHQLAQLQEKMEEMIDQEQSILDQIEAIQQEMETPSLTLESNNDEKKQELLEAKEQLAEDFLETLSKANEIAERSRRSQGLLSRELGDWMRETSGRGIYEDINREKQMPLIRYGIWDSVKKQEEQILDKLQQTAADLNEVAQNIISSELEGMQLALNQLQNLMNTDQDNPSGNPSNPLSARAISGSTQSGQTNSASAGEESWEQTQNQQSGTPSSQNQNRQGNNPSGQNQANPSQQPNSSPVGSANQPNEESSQPPASSANNQREGNESGNRPYGGASGPGGSRRLSLNNRLLSPEAMRRFIESDYTEWRESLRNAEQLLPGDTPFREEISRIRENIDEMRRDFTRNRQAPKYDLFLENISTPLIKTAHELEQEINAILSKEEFAIVDEGNIPDQYQNQVAEYFKNLSEIGTTQE